MTLLKPCSMCLLVFLISVLIVPNYGARILAMYPTPSISHQVVFRPLMLELARRGHEVVVITTDPVKPEEAPANFTQIDVHDLSYDYWKREIVPNIDGSGDTWKFIETALVGFLSVYEQQFLSPDVQRLLNSNQKFDLIFVEVFARPAYVLSHIFNAPMVLFSSMSFIYPVANVIGAVDHVMFYPDPLRKRLYDLSLFEKVSIVVDDLRLKRYTRSMFDKENDLVKRVFGPNVPSIHEMSNNVALFFVNVHPIWDDNRPVPPSVVYTGGLHLKPAKELPEELKSYLDNSKNGVIYMSFGSNVDPTLLSPERIQIFCKVFSELNFDVLWKWNGDVLPGKPDNVRISKWLPQADLLRHPKIKMFITQGGLQSTDEAIVAGVPLLAFPMLGDQWYNAEKYEHHGIGIQMQFETFTEDSLRQGIKTIIEDKKYRDNIVRLRSLMHDQPQTSLQRAVWWTEHVLRHGGQHLRSPQANVSWSEYLVLDVVLVLFSAALLSVLVVGYALYKLSTVICSVSPKSKLKYS